jgi:hypothetical protein
VLTNALYFKADWLQPFPAEDTRDGPFHLPNGVEVKVPLMHLHGTLACAEVDGVQIVRLPYVDPDYAFDAALPAAVSRSPRPRSCCSPTACEVDRGREGCSRCWSRCRGFRIQGSFSLGMRPARARPGPDDDARCRPTSAASTAVTGQLFVDERGRRRSSRLARRAPRRRLRPRWWGRAAAGNRMAKAFQAESAVCVRAARPEDRAGVVSRGVVVDPRAQ